MITCTVHERDEIEGNIETRAGKIIFVREGIAWWALFFPLIWILFHRLWLVLLLYLAAVFVIGAAAELADIPEAAGGLATMALSFLLALEGNDLRRWTLKRKGYALADVTGGRDMAECEQRFFESWLPAQEQQRTSATPAPSLPRESKANQTSAAPGGDDVIGLFPEPGR